MGVRVIPAAVHVGVTACTGTAVKGTPMRTRSAEVINVTGLRINPKVFFTISLPYKIPTPIP